MMGWLITTLSLRQMKGKNLLRCWYKKVRAITWIFLNATLNQNPKTPKRILKINIKDGIN